MFGLVRVWGYGLYSVGVWVAATLLLRGWSDRLPDPTPLVVAVPVDRPADPPVVVPAPPPTVRERVTAWRPGLDRTTAYLVGGSLLALLGVGGGRAFWWLRLRSRGRADDPRHERSPEQTRIKRPDGTELHVEFSGPADGPLVVLTHGWGACATEWFYLRRQLPGCRLVAWDLPGLGRSTSPKNKDFRLGKLAGDLHAVLHECGGGRPAVLLGHSIGGMITLEYCKRFPEEAARQAGLVLVHTSPTNPLRVTEGRWYVLPLQKPLLEPLAHLTKVAAPLVWAMNLLGYFNGSLHRSNHKQLFAGTETWGQLEFVTRFVPWVWPATYARGVLGMLHWDARDVPGTITVPTLVVAAAGDRILQPDASRAIADACPTARLVTLAPAGHMGLIERHAEVGRLVADFVREVAGRPAVATPS